MAIMLFSILLSLAVLNAQASRSAELADYSSFVRIASAWGDVSDDVSTLAGLNVSRNSENLSFTDRLPASGIPARFAGLAALLSAHYAIGLDVALSNASGAQSFSGIAPPFELWPYGINYSYGNAWAKDALLIESPSNNYSALSSATLVVNASGLWFAGNMDRSCSSWTDYSACLSNCFNLTLVLVDANGSVNRSTCTTFIPTAKNTLHVALANYSSSGWVEVSVGALPTLLNISFVNVSVATQVNFTLPSRAFRVYLPLNLSVADNYFNASKKERLRAA